MKRAYSSPKLATFKTVDDLANHLQKRLAWQQSELHELMNLLQVITGECEVLEMAANDPARIKKIREAAFKIRDRLKELKKSA